MVVSAVGPTYSTGESDQPPKSLDKDDTLDDKDESPDPKRLILWNTVL